MQQERPVSATLAVEVEKELTFEGAEARERAKSHEPSPLVRTLSNPDLSGRKRSKSNVSQCSRSRALTRTQVSIDELMMASSSKSSYCGQARPTPVGMAASSTTDDEVDIKAFESEDGKLSSSFNLGDADKLNGKTATEVLEARRERQKQKEAAFSKLRLELARAHQELRKRDEECKKLSSVRDDLDKEVEDLTASLFEEAHKMVTEAKMKQATAEMQFKEARMKMDGLEAEVSALKLLVITSTPSNPGKKGHRRAPSADQICADCQTYHCASDGASLDNEWDVIETQQEKEVDRISHREFVSWLEKHCPMSDHPFLESIERTEVIPCLQFPNQELAAEIFKSIKDNTLIVEAVTGPQKTRRCSLSKASVLCSFRIRTGENGKWHFISNACRARVIAVAELFTFLRYIRQGLIRKEVNSMYWDLMHKRGQISLSRLGLVRV